MNYELIYGAIFGVLFMTIIYTSIRFFYSKEISYISYSLMQIFSLLYIVSYSEIFQLSNFILELSLLLATLFAILFSISFYKGIFLPAIRDNKSLFINTILLNIVILTSFYHYMLFEYLPYTIVYAILFVSVIFNMKKAYKPILIYVIGWSIFCLLLFIFDFKNYYESKNFVDIVLVAFVIEAILFTISVSYKYGEQKQHNLKIEDMLVQQSKLAKTGELIANITHQFRQPLNNISYILINIKNRFENNNLTKEYFSKKISQANEQLNYLSNTVEQFKEFYTPNKNKEDFEIKDALENALTILDNEIKKRGTNIFVSFDTNEKIKVYGIKNELAQVFLILLSNANDALKDIYEPKIGINISASSSEVIIKLSDNGKGVEEKSLKKIFEAYFTTKEEGIGLGLYMAKTIIEDSFNGKITLTSSKKGTIFTLKLEKSI